MEWISINKMMPEPFLDVLVYAINTHGDTYDKGEKYLAIDRIVQWNDMPLSFRTDRFYGEVTHWMPLPKLPI